MKFIESRWFYIKKWKMISSFTLFFLYHGSFEPYEKNTGNILQACFWLAKLMVYYCIFISNQDLFFLRSPQVMCMCEALLFNEIVIISNCLIPLNFHLEWLNIGSEERRRETEQTCMTAFQIRYFCFYFSARNLRFKEIEKFAKYYTTIKWLWDLKPSLPV